MIDRLKSLPFEQPKTQALYAHLSQHCIANRPPSPNRLRYFYRDDGQHSRTVKLRLFRQGDDFHADRKHGRVAPRHEDLPEEFHGLVDWYWNEYTSPQNATAPPPDPILGLRGVGREVWRALGGVAFIEKLRAGWFGEHDKGDRA